MKIKIPDKTYGLVDFYDQVAIEMGAVCTANLKYDCTKVNVAPNIQDGFYEYYKGIAEETGADENDIKVGITMMLAINGPKVDENLKANEVEIFDGFIGR